MSNLFPPRKRWIQANSVVAKKSLVLDDYPADLAAYSVRKLNSNYSGSALRVKRSSDNAELDIGFDGSGNLDTASLLSFIGSNNGILVTWYDQSGNGKNLTQVISTSSRIVKTGSLVTLGTQARAAIEIGGGGGQFSYGCANFSTTTLNRFMSVIAGKNLSPYYSTWVYQLANSSWATLGSAGIALYIPEYSASKVYGDFSNQRAIFNAQADWTIPYVNVFEVNKSEATKYKARHNSVVLGTGTPPYSPLDMTSKNFGLVYNNVGLTISELLLYGNSTQEESTVVAIQNNVNNYYGIY